MECRRRIVDVPSTIVMSDSIGKTFESEQMEGVFNT